MSDELVRERVRLYAADVTPAQLPSFAGVAVRRRRRRVRQTLAGTSSVLVVVLVVVFTALAARPGGRSGVTPNSSLESRLVGPTWTLVSITSAGAVWSAPSSSRWSLTLTKTTYKADDGCNSGSGDATIRGDTLTLGNGAMTEIGCIGADAERLQKAFQLLATTPAKASVVGDTLTLTVGSQVLTLASGTSPATSLEDRLVGPTWRLRALSHDGKALADVPALGATVSFTAHGYTADDGCNDLKGTVAYGAGSITYTDISGSAMLCPATQDRSHVLDALLRGVASVTLSDNTLALSAGSDVGVLTLISTSTPAASASDPAGAALESWLTATTWLLDSITSGGKTWHDRDTGRDGQRATLVFGPHGYRINPDCNDHSGAVSYAGGELIMRAYMQTAMACAQADVVQAKSADVADALFTGPITYVQQGGSLVLSSQQATITFNAGPAPTAPLALDLPPASAVVSASPAADLQTRLVGPTWLLETWSQGGATTRVPASSGAEIVLATQTVRADDGCSSRSGALAYAGSTLRTSGLTAALFKCQGGSGAISAAYTRLFSHDVGAALNEGTLVLTGGGVVMTFVAQPPAPPSGSSIRSLLIVPTWKLDSFKSATVDWKAKPTSTATLTMTATDFEATDGCGSLSSGLAFDPTGRVLSFRGDVVSEGVCAMASPGPPLGTMAPDAYFKALNGSLQATLTGATLTLTSSSTVMIFSR